MHRIDIGERRRRLAVRHGLGGGAFADPGQVARELVALHATDPATVYLSLRARLGGELAAGETVAGAAAAWRAGGQVTVAEIEDALYERRDLVRMLGMRRTVFAVPAESVPVIQASTTDRIAQDQRKLLLKLISEAVVDTEPEAWLADVERSVLRLFDERGGTASAAELSAAEPRLRTRLVLAAGKPYQAMPTITSRVLLVLAAQGQIVRGRPLGSWLSQQYRWALAERWLPAVLGAGGDAAGGRSIGGAQARVELARQWLAAFGPAPLTDLKWWTGWTMGQVREAVSSIGAVEVALGTGEGTGTGVALADDLDATTDPGTWVSLLPALDPTPMGWADRSWYLGPHAKALFDNTGNIGPTIWLNGRIAGGWAQRADGEIAIRLLEDVGADARALIDAEAGRLGAWLGDRRVIPRFRTPTERALSA